MKVTSNIISILLIILIHYTNNLKYLNFNFNPISFISMTHIVIHIMSHLNLLLIINLLFLIKCYDLLNSHIHEFLLDL